MFKSHHRQAALLTCHFCGPCPRRCCPLSVESIFSGSFPWKHGLFFLTFFNASQLIVTGVEAKHRLKNTNTAELLSKTKPAGWSSQTHQDVTGRVCFQRLRGDIVLYSCTLSGTVTSKSQSLAILGPNHNTASPPLPRSSSPPLLWLLSLLLCIITQVIVE